MTKWLLTCLILLSTSQLQAQLFAEEPAEPRRIQIGLDIAKPIVALLKQPINNYPLKSESFWSIEPLITVQQASPNLFWLGQLGVSHFGGAGKGATTYNMTGSFWKVGVEWRSPYPFLGCIAALVTTSVWQVNGSLQLPATAFGTYSTPIPATVGLASGIEIQGNRDLPLGRRIMLRFSSRFNFFWKNNVGQQLETPYIPGLGLYITANRPEEPTGWLGMTGGINAQLFYMLDSSRGIVSRRSHR